MKKSLVLASLLAAFGAASAQSSVTLSGATSFGYQNTLGNQNAAGALNTTKIKGLTETDMSIVVSGREALGNGLTAGFSLELDNGSSVGQFRAPVSRKNTSISLGGASTGTVTLANTRSSETAVRTWIAPTNLDAGFYDGQVFSRSAIDLLGYSYTAGPITAGVSYTESGNAQPSGAATAFTAGAAGAANAPLTGNGVANSGNVLAGTKTTTLSASYTAGPLLVAGAYKMSKFAAGTAFRKNNFELAATYNLDFARVGLGYDTKPASLAAPANDKAALTFGVNVPFGPAAVGVNYAKRGSAKIVEVGAQYNLSPRTNVNLSIGQNKSAASVSSKQNRISVNHAF